MAAECRAGGQTKGGVTTACSGVEAASFQQRGSAYDLVPTNVTNVICQLRQLTVALAVVTVNNCTCFAVHVSSV